MIQKMKRVKIDDMVGYPLCFIVALAEGYEYKTVQEEIEKDFWKKGVKTLYLEIDEHRDQCGVKVSPYSGSDYYTPTNNWELIGQLFEKYNPKTTSDYNNEVFEARIEFNGKVAYGKSFSYPMAICKAIAYLHFGEYAEVPEILVRHMESSTVKKCIIENDPEFGVCVKIEYLDGSIDLDYQPDKEQSIEDFIENCRIRAKKFKYPIEIKL